MTLTRQGLMLAGSLAVVLAASVPARATDRNGVEARIQADAAIQQARAAREAATQVLAEVAPTNRRQERVLAHRQRLLQDADRELQVASGLFDAGDHVHARQHATLAARLATGTTQDRGGH